MLPAILRHVEQKMQKVETKSETRVTRLTQDRVGRMAGTELPSACAQSCRLPYNMTPQVKLVVPWEKELSMKYTFVDRFRTETPSGYDYLQLQLYSRMISHPYLNSNPPASDDTTEWELNFCLLLAPPNFHLTSRTIAELELIPQYLVAQGIFPMS